MSEQTKHSYFTRIAHMALAASIIIQMGSSLIFQPARDGRAGDIFFDIHQYSGLLAFVLALIFWMIILFRRKGTALGLLMPWTSEVRRSALIADLKMYYAALKSYRMPTFETHSPVASAVHGLGLLLMLAMAGTGTIYYFINTGNSEAGGLVGVVMFIHESLANLVWAYLLGHAGLGVLHHYMKNMNLSEMWSVRQ
jgi:cytochrome b561